MSFNVDIYGFLQVADRKSGQDERENHQKPEIFSVMDVFSH
jgi:hypothetical protein